MPPQTDFQPDLPLPYENYEKDLLAWVIDKEREGDQLIKAEPGYDEIDKSISYIMGEQGESRRPSELSHVNLNLTKHIILQTVSGLTDIHPLFGFKTYNNNFAGVAEVLQRMSMAWWINNFCDLKLADTIRYSAGAGTGYCEIKWDASAAGGQGDIVMVPRDPRDVLPINPTFDQSLQSWEGVIVRSAMGINELRARYPEKAYRLVPDRSSSTMLTRTWTRAKRLMSQISSPAPVDVMMQNSAHNAPSKITASDVLTIYIKDRRIHTGNVPIKMGDPNTSWCYTVYPINFIKPDGKKAGVEDSRLYPRGRMIVCTRKVVLYDGPNPYWHGMFPLAKLCLDPWPWALLGLGLAHDLLPLQDALNETVNGVMDAVRKTLRPGVIADKKVVPESVWQRIDTRQAGLKLKTNPAAGKTLEFTEPPILPTYIMEMITLLKGTMDEISGVANMTALTQLQQAPGADSIERMMEALTPVLRLKGRLLEAFLREMGEMVKCNFFQFYNLPRRVSMLGEAGLDFTDFDFDPGTLVPALSKQDTGYVQQLDKDLYDRPTRAQWFHKNFTFQITPNSLLAISQISRKLMYLQLARMQPPLMDRWSLYEVLEIPNGGTPPGDAITITDRLKAEQVMFPPPGAEPVGRPPTAQQMPSIQEKDQGTRQTISESGS